MAIWKITWNKNLYDYKARINDFIDNGNDIISQSKGQALMKNIPREGDIAYISCDKKLIMKVKVISKFQKNNIGDSDKFDINNVSAPHRTHEYNFLKILKIYNNNMEFKGNQRTWTQLNTLPINN